MSKEEKLRELALSALDGSEVSFLLSSLNMSKADAIEGYLEYNLDVSAYSNEIYQSLGTRFAMHIQNLIKKSWHDERQGVVLDMLNKIKPKSIVDMGFGVPGRYVREYALKNNVNLTLTDFYPSAFEFSGKLLDFWDSKWKDSISFDHLDMNSLEHPGDFDCYIFMDSIEHIKAPAKYLKKVVSKSGSKSKFILSIPIGPMIPSHTIGWENEKEAISWLEDNGLTIERIERICPNPDVDLFASEVKGEIYDLLVSCSKKSKIGKLPLLDYAVDISSPSKLDNTLLIVCHHVLESNLILVDYLVKSGIRPENVRLIGKAYSTSKKMLNWYKDLDINVHEKSLAFDSHLLESTTPHHHPIL